VLGSLLVTLLKGGDGLWELVLPQGTQRQLGSDLQDVTSISLVSYVILVKVVGRLRWGGGAEVPERLGIYASGRLVVLPP
jgi:hypothetical protein